MEHDVAIRHQGPQVSGAQVEVEHLGPVADQIEVLEFLADVVVVGHVVDDAHLVAIVEQSLRQMGTDEPRAAGDQRSHLAVTPSSGLPE